MEPYSDLPAWTEKARPQDLPEIYQEIAALIGLDPTLKLARAFGGQMVYFPQISESIVAWWATTLTDYQGEIYVYEDGAVTRLTDNSWPDQNVRVSGNTVVWEARPDGNDYEIYMATKGPVTGLDPNEYHAVATTIKAWRSIS